jgi:DNA-binding MltR family transcriptional regulator
MNPDDLRAVRWFSVFHESDRGTVVSGVALVDDALTKLILAKMSALDHYIPGPIHKFRESLFSPEGQGCFSSLHSKYQIAYAMGWISEQTHKDIKILGRIRNRAAHDFDHFTFISKDVIKQLRKLSQLSDWSDEDLLSPGCLPINFYGSDISYLAGGPSAKTEFMMALFEIVEVLDIEIHCAKIPPKHEITLQMGDVVQINHGFLNGFRGIVRSLNPALGMVQVHPLGEFVGGLFSDEQVVYYYDLVLQESLLVEKACRFELGDLVEVRNAEFVRWFTRGKVVTINLEEATLEAVCEGGMRVIYRGFWDEFVKCAD